MSTQISIREDDRNNVKERELGWGGVAKRKES